MESLKNAKFTELSINEKESVKGGLTGTFWIGDTNVSKETGGAIDLNSGWSKDSTKKTDSGDRIYTGIVEIVEVEPGLEL